MYAAEKNPKIFCLSLFVIYSPDIFYDGCEILLLEWIRSVCEHINNKGYVFSLQDILN